MSCNKGQECKPKYIPLIPYQIPNQNQSHIEAVPLPGSGGPPQTECSDKFYENDMQAKGFPTSPPYNAQCNGCYDIPTGHQRSCDCNDCVNAREVFHAQSECAQHVEGNQWQDLRKVSPVPEVNEIRDKLRNSSGVKDNLRWCPDDETLPCVIRRFRQGSVGYLGQAVVHPGAAQDCDFPKHMVHGVQSEDFTPAGGLINPPQKTWIQSLENDLKESIYESNRFAPIGKSHNQLDNLPPHVDPETTSFGIPSDISTTAGMLINPPKDRFTVDEETEERREFYKFSHGSYNPGEQMCRNYVGGFKRTNTFGKQSPHDNAGRACKLVVGTWRNCKPDPPFVNKVYSDHLDQRYPKLGKPLDRLCGGRDRGDCFTYGKHSDQEKERPIREIIFNRCPNDGADKSMKIMKNLKDWVAKVRHNIKSAFGADLESLYEAFQLGDKDCDGTIQWEPFMSALAKESIPRTLDCAEFMEALAYVNIYHPPPCNKVNYYLLMDLIKGHMDPQFLCRTTTLKPYYLPHTNSCIHFRTTYSDLCSNMCVPQSCIQWAKEQRVYGMPSVRTDKLPNKIRSTKDTTNYGDDGDAYSLIWPSVYTVRGITCRDALRELTKEEMAKILCGARINISHCELDSAWEIAKQMDPDKKGRVCYQTFREALTAFQNELKIQMGCQDEFKVTDCLHDEQYRGCAKCVEKPGMMKGQPPSHCVGP